MLSSDKKKKDPLKISIGARPSPLSKVQVIELWEEIKQHYPEIEFDIAYINTIGDHDQKTSLREMGKSNFFTKEIDEAVLSGTYRIGVHSAKDLPQPIPDGLKIVCFTKGVDSSDSLVMKQGMRLEDLGKGAKIGTSSLRREEMLREVRSDFTFSDIRGTIHQRLQLLETGQVDGVVIAEAALIRLGLTYLNRVKVPGETVLGQGQLAVVARSNDHEMEEMFSMIDVRKKNYKITS